MRHILAQPPDGRPMQDGTAQALAAFLEAQTPRMVDLVVRTEVLAARLRAQPPDFTVCHTDLHARNLLIRPDGRLYLVDWDAPLRAPKERDLMFVGGAQYGPTRTPAEEERLFYAGYGPTEVNPTALAYYRAVRIVEDLAIYCEQIFLSMEGGEDRVRALEFVRVNFQPGGTIDAAYRQK
jgi:spectinomycin phosphotransferase